MKKRSFVSTVVRITNIDLQDNEHRSSRSTRLTVERSVISKIDASESFRILSCQAYMMKITLSLHGLYLRF